MGAPGYDVNTDLRAGAVYVFRYINGSWQEVQQLIAGDPDQDDNFGFDVAIRRNIIVVGAPGDDEADVGADSGATYIFEWNGTMWAQTRKLMPTAPSAAISMGTSVDIEISIPDEGVEPEQTNVAAGAPWFDSGHGVVFFYRLNGSNWEQLGNLQDDDTTVNQRGQSGTNVSLRGDLLVMGAPAHGEPSSNSGTAYGFGRGQTINSWIQSGQYEPPSAVASERIGNAVAAGRIGNQYIAVIGAPQVSTSLTGRVLVFDSAGPPEEFTEADAHNYGASVAIYGGQIAIGAPNADVSFANSGSVYFLTLDSMGTWQKSGTLVASDPGVGKEFGVSVALDTGTLMVGSPSFDNMPRPGAVYFYSSGIFSDGFESGDTTAW